MRGVALLLALMVVPIASAQLPSAAPVGFIQIRAPHLVEVVPGETIDVAVHLQGTLQCEPGNEPPAAEHVYMSYGRGYGAGGLQVWEVTPDTVEVAWTDAGEDKFVIDRLVKFQVRSEGAPENAYNHAGIWDLEGRGNTMGSCTPAGYQIYYGEGQSAFVVEAANPSEAKGSPGPGAVVLIALLGLGVILRRRS